MVPPPPRPARRPPASLPLLAFALAFGGLWWGLRPAGPPPPPPADAFSADPLARAAAAALGSSPATLLRLGVDEDWRVRAAAFEALTPDAPDLPSRDTPMAERETRLLARLAPSDLCASLTAAPHARYGSTLVAACLACHAGPDATARADAGCARCHAGEHAAFAGSAHANSLSHLRLPTADPVTREVGFFGFGDRRGLSCVACHAEAPAGADPAGCVAAFTSGAESCAACHARAAADHAAWAAAERPVRVAWPSGSLDYIQTPAGEAPGCADCHTDHRFAARRDPAFLASGLHAAFVRGSQGESLLRLTNLAGHRHPAGTGRRALDVAIVLDGEAFPLTRLATALPPGAEPPSTAIAPALAPAESRDFPLPPGADAAASLTLRVTYLRDRFAPDAYRVDLPVPTPRLPPRLHR